MRRRALPASGSILRPQKHAHVQEQRSYCAQGASSFPRRDVKKKPVQQHLPVQVETRMGEIGSRADDGTV